MGRRKACLAVAGAVAIAVLVAGCGMGGAEAPAAKAEQPLPSSINIGTNSAGTLFYSLGSGLAKVISDHAPVQAVVQPYTGTSTFLPLIESGELEMGIVNAVDMAMAYRGPEKLKVGGRNPFQPSPSARLIMRGAPLYLVEWVRKDSDIKSVADLKGRRVTGEYSAHLAVWFNQYGVLASCELTWDDIQVVPVPAVNDGMDALIQGRADAAPHALGSAKVREADSSVGIRAIPVCADEEGQRRIREAVPGYYPVQLKAGRSTGVVEDTWVIGYDIYFIANKDVPDKVVYEALKPLWENNADLVPIHATFKEWTTDRAVDPGVTIPYHTGAISFFKEKGVWTTEVDQRQKALLEEAAS